MSVIEDIQVDVAIVLGAAQVPIRQLLRMSRGATIPLDTDQEEPSLVFVNNKLVARGKVLVNEDQMSIEITDVIRREGR